MISNLMKYMLEQVWAEYIDNPDMLVLFILFYFMTVIMSGDYFLKVN